MKTKRLAMGLAALIALTALIVVVGIICHCSLKQSDATIDRIDHKIEEVLNR